MFYLFGDRQTTGSKFKSIDVRSNIVASGAVDGARDEGVCVKREELDERECLCVKPASHELG